MVFAKTVPVNITTGLNTSYSIKLKNDLTLHAKKISRICECYV